MHIWQNILFATPNFLLSWLTRSEETGMQRFIYVKITIWWSDSINTFTLCAIPLARFWNLFLVKSSAIEHLDSLSFHYVVGDLVSTASLSLFLLVLQLFISIEFPVNMINACALSYEQINANSRSKWKNKVIKMEFLSLGKLLAISFPFHIDWFSIFMREISW